MRVWLASRRMIRLHGAKVQCGDAWGRECMIINGRKRFLLLCKRSVKSRLWVDSNPASNSDSSWRSRNLGFTVTHLSSSGEIFKSYSALEEAADAHDTERSCASSFPLLLSSSQISKCAASLDICSSTGVKDPSRVDFFNASVPASKSFQ